MPPKRQLAHLAGARVLAKQRKIEIRGNVETVAFEDESTEGS